MDTQRNFHPILIFVFLFVLNVLVYHNAIHNELRYDQPEVYQGADIPRFADRLAYAFSLKSPDPSTVPDLLWFRPAAFLLSWQLFLAAGKQLYLINIFNIVLLTVTGFILFRLVHYLSGNPFLAFIAGVMFCVHPVNGLWVYYAPGGVHGFLVLSFMLLSMHCFMIFVNDRRDRGALVLSLLSFGSGLLFHEIACFLPLYLALCVHFLIKKDRLKAYLWLIPYVVILLGYLLLRSAMLKGGSIIEHLRQGLDTDLLLYGLTLTKVFMLFLGKLLTLNGIVINWCEPLMKSFSWEWCLITGALVSAFLYLIRKGRGLAAWAAGLIFAGFVPVCIGGTSGLKEGVLYEGHWLFFTSIGFFVLVACLMAHVCRRWPKTGAIVLLCLAVLWVRAAWHYNTLYADEIRYALHYKKYAPGYRMTTNFLFEAYCRRKDYDRAQQVLMEAKVGDNSDYILQYFIALMDVRKGDYPQAEKHILEALQMEPGLVDSYVLLGQIHLKQGRPDLAEQAFHKAKALEGN